MTQKELIATIAGMSNEEQKKVFEELKKNGLTEKEVQTIREMTFFYKLYNDKNSTTKQSKQSGTTFTTDSQHKEVYMMLLYVSIKGIYAMEQIETGRILR